MPKFPLLNLLSVELKAEITKFSEAKKKRIEEHFE